MSPGLVWSNIFAYSLQIGLVVGLGALVPAALRMRIPRARLLYWQVLLVACVTLPWIRSWRQQVVSGAIQVSTVVTAVSSPATPVHRAIPFMAIALWLLAAGVAIRLGLLIAGLVRLRAYRRRGRELPPELRMPGATSQATPLLSDDVAGPVTFGWRNPVVLLPTSFSSLEGEMRDAILCHELLHVARRDWLFTIAEELVRALLWFHPAVWWVIGEIQLAREQTVDQLVIETTQAREPYVDTLLLMAGVSSPIGAPLDLASAPMFLRRRHLKRRLLEVVKEVRMTTISKTRLACITAAAVVMIAAACWLATATFPLSAAPQIVDDAPGVEVNLYGSELMHRSPVPYPAAALAKGIEGTIVVQLKLDSTAEVSDAAVLSGPEELRKSVLQSVLNWHFDKSLAFTTQTVNINFARLPNTSSAATRPAALPASALPRTFTTGKLERIAITGLSEHSTAELASQLPVREGDVWSPQVLAAVNRTAKAFDSRLNTILARNSHGGFELRISPGYNRPARVATAPTLPPAMPATFTPLASGVYSVGNGTTPPTLISHPDPQYSEQARAAKYSGEVMLSIVVDTDGKAENIHVIKSLGMGLDEKAAEAVGQWVFKPAMREGVPVNVRANVAVNFRLL